MIAAAFRAFDGHVPPFLLRGVRLTTNNPECRGLIYQPSVPEPQEAASPLECRFLPPSPKSQPARLPAPPSSTAEAARIAAVQADIERLNARLEEARNGRGTGGLALSTRLKRLRAAHNINPIALPLPLGPAIDAKSIRIRGYAATCDIDDDRARFLQGCWPKLDAAKIKLCIAHDITREAGTLDSIEVDALGRVVIIATVVDSFAMRLPGLSVSASVDKFTIRNPGRRDFVGEIEAIREVQEISLTSTPANRQCLVFERREIPDYGSSGQEMIDHIHRMREMILALQARAA